MLKSYKKLSHQIKTRIGFKLIGIISLLLVLIGFIFVSVNSYLYWVSTNINYKNEMKRIAEFSAEINTSNVWNFDFNNIQKYVNNAIKNKMVYAVVYEFNGERDTKNGKVSRFYGGTAKTVIDTSANSIADVILQTNSFTDNFSIPIKYYDEEIGSVHLYFSNEYILDDLRSQITSFLLNFLLFLCIFSISIYYFFSNQLIKPLNRLHQLAMNICGVTTYLSESISQERWSHVHALLTAEKNREKSTYLEGRKDELGDFMQTFFLVLNGFEVTVSELAQYSSQLSELNKELEFKISDRTSELEKSNIKLTESLVTLQQTQGQLLQQEKLASIGQLAAGVAHEINNPIGYVGSNINRLGEYFEELKTYIDQLEEYSISINPDKIQQVNEHIAGLKKKLDFDFLMEDHQSIVSDCREGIARVKDIVQSLKDFSHNSGSNEFSSVNINDAITTTLKVVNNEIKYACNILLELQLGETVKANLGQMHQVFSNIIVNAAHAMSEKNIMGTLTIKTYKKDEFAVIEIRDTGNGIPESARDNVFDPFFTTKPIGKGTGLGLNICYDIVVNKHHGNLTFSTELGVGTVFTIMIPFSK